MDTLSVSKIRAWQDTFRHQQYYQRFGNVSAINFPLSDGMTHRLGAVMQYSLSDSLKLRDPRLIKPTDLDER